MLDSQKAGRGKKQTGEKGKKKRDYWIPKIFDVHHHFGCVQLGFIQCAQRSGIYYRLLLLAAFILIGIVFDIIGVSVTVAEERPFHSMAAHGEKSASCAMQLIRNAEKVSSV